MSFIAVFGEGLQTYFLQKWSPSTDYYVLAGSTDDRDATQFSSADEATEAASNWKHWRGGFRIKEIKPQGGS